MNFTQKMDLNDTKLSICRVCLGQNEALKSIFTLENFSDHMLQVNEVMTTCASILVEIDDGLPQQICTECLRRLSEAFAFKNLCEQTDFALRNNLVLIVKSGVNQHEDSDHVNIPEASVKENIVSESEEVVDFTENLNDQHDFDSLEDEHDNEIENFNTIEIPSKSRRTYKCEICGKGLASKKSLWRHNKLHCNEKPYKCEICDQRYALKVDLDTHKKTHSDIKPYICDVCGLGVNYYSNLCRHKKIFHGPVKLRECHICKNFFSDEALEPHLATHTPADKTHQCDHCGKCFYNSSKLRRHIKTHTGSECSICRRYFPDKTSLELHRSSHTEADKTHHCSLCGMCFYTRTKLLRHVGTHTGQKKPHGCFICDKHFRDSSNLRQHMKIHTGEKSYECDVCGKFFTVKTTLTKHKKQHAKNKLIKDETESS